jgi:hypothetical protein
MRLWLHEIWRSKNECICQTMGPRDDKPFEELIRTYSEDVVRLAWALYVYSEPPAYFLEPQQVVDSYVSPKTGRTNYNMLRDDGKVTRFPLAAFRAVSEAYIVEAMMILEDLERDPIKKHVKKLPQGDTVFIEYPSSVKGVKEEAHKAAFFRPRHSTVKPSWGFTEPDSETEGDE